MVKLKCFCVNFLISWKSGNTMTKIALVFTSGLLSICVTVWPSWSQAASSRRGAWMEDAHKLTLLILLCAPVPAHQNQTIHFLTSFSGVLTAVTSEHFTNSN